MITYLKDSAYVNGKNIIQIACNSGDTKPTSGVATGSICYEANTGKKFMFDEESGDWVEFGSGGGGGGGGGGDYTTAEVTVISTSETMCLCAVPYIYDDAGYEGLYLLDVIENDTAEVTVPLYKGMCQAIFILESLSIAVTGDIVEDHGYCTITGNGTITITD